MVLNTKRIFIAMICTLFIFGLTVVTTATAEVNPFASNDSDSFIKLVGCGSGKCGSEEKCGGAGKCGNEKTGDNDAQLKRAVEELLKELK